MSLAVSTRPSAPPALSAADIALPRQDGPGQGGLESRIRERCSQDLRSKVRVGGNDARLALLQPREVADIVLSGEVHVRRLIDNLP